MAARADVKRRFSVDVPTLKEFVLELFGKVGRDNIPRLAASFSFYALLSFAPFLVLAVTVSAYIFGKSGAADHLLQQAEAVGGAHVRDYLASVIASSQKKSAGAVATVLSLLVTFFSASNLFMQLDDAVNGIWQIQQTATFIKNLIVTRIIAFISVFLFGMILVSWLVIDSVIAWLAKNTGGFPGWKLVSFLAAVIFLTFAFAVTIRALPRGKLQWSDVWPGSFVTAFGVGVSKLLLSVYFAQTSGVYGAAGGVIVLLLWMYYTAMIYFFGIEVTYAYAHRYGSLKGKPEKPVCLDPEKQGLTAS